MSPYDRCCAIQRATVLANDGRAARLADAQEALHEYVVARSLPGLSLQATSETLSAGGDAVYLSLTALCRILFECESTPLPKGIVDLDQERERRGPRLGIVVSGSGGGEPV